MVYIRLIQILVFLSIFATSYQISSASELDLNLDKATEIADANNFELNIIKRIGIKDF